LLKLFFDHFDSLRDPESIVKYAAKTTWRGDRRNDPQESLHDQRIVKIASERQRK
jgi:hypothetical protein